jgi:hypothetical protein
MWIRINNGLTVQRSNGTTAFRDKNSPFEGGKGDVKNAKFEKNLI